MDVIVQPSIGWQDLNTQLSQLDSGLFFPIDPGTCISSGEMPVVPLPGCGELELVR